MSLLSLSFEVSLVSSPVLSGGGVSWNYIRYNIYMTKVSRGQFSFFLALFVYFLFIYLFISNYLLVLNN